MDELRILVVLVAITLVVVGVFVYFGRKISKAAERNAEHIGLPIYITRTGTVVFAVVVAFWVYCVATRALSPESSFGQYLATFDGVASVALGSCILVGVASAVAGKLGYPIARWHRDSDTE